ncbi:hypothetical protein IX51_04990 [uncultured archaeon]|nr:hypothetical protein IX51_04990 [uncultured archaeon]
MIVAIVGLSTLLAYESAATFQSSPLVSSTPSVNYGYYISSENITVVTYSYEPSGSPYNGLHIYVNSQNDTSYPLVSNNAGFANVTMPYNQTSKQPLSFNYTYNIFGRTISVPKTQIAVNPLIMFSGYTIVPRLVDNHNTSNFGFQVLYVGANGSKAPLTHISVATYQQGETSSEVVSNATYSTNVSGFSVINVFPKIPDHLYNQTFGLAVISNGQNVTTSGPYAFPLGRLSTYSPMTQERLQTLVFSGIGPILGFLIPILGVFAAYLTYGKDRTTGVLESVLKRPVTRQGLISSRFVANSVSIVASVIVSMIFADLIIMHYFSLGLSTYFSLFFIWTYIVEGLSFLALIYMFAHVVKSQGALLGVSIAVFVVMALFWSIIPFTILAALNIAPASSTYIFASVVFNYASPSGYSSLVQFLFTNHIGLLSTLSANPAAYAVTEPLLIAAGILWIAVPFGIAYYLSKKYD